MVKKIDRLETSTASSDTLRTDSRRALIDAESENLLGNFFVDQVDKLNSRIEETEIKVSRMQVKAKGDLDVFKDDTKKDVDNLRDRSDRTIETIGIFAALLSFVTFEAQIFKSDLNGWTLIGLSSLLLGALLIFVLALGNTFNKNKDKYGWSFIKQPLAAFSIALVLIGMVGASFGYNTDNREQEEIKEIKRGIAELILSERSKSLHIKDRVSKIEEKINNLPINMDYKELLKFKNCIATKGLSRCL